jgi:ArsR family transcriptional regulator
MLILHALQKQEMCVCELTELVKVDQSTVSKHLSILKNVGLIEDEKKGMKIFYRILCPCVEKFFSCLEQIINQQMQKYSKKHKSKEKK